VQHTHVYKVLPRKDKRGADVISDALPFGRLWYDGPNAVRVPFSNAIRADLRGVRKLVTTSGNTRFVGERNAYGHCDRFWALALAFHAAKQPASGAITTQSLRQIRFGSDSGRIGRKMPLFTPRTLSAAPFQAATSRPK
jgi:hypothetical protein